MKIFLKSQKGFVGADIVIGLAILMLFMVLITTVYVNTNNSAMSIQRTAKATEIITNIFEKIDLLYYDELVVSKNDEGKFEKTVIDLTDTSKISDDYKKIMENINKPEGYNVEMTITPYEKEVDLIKKISITVKYKVGRKEEEITMHKLKARENIIIPNKPVLEEGYFPIKLVMKNGEKKWFETTTEDKEWYNYANNSWAYSANRSDADVNVIDGEVTFKEGKEPLVWIPAYGKNESNEYKYLYNITGKSTIKSDASGALITVISDENVTVLADFKDDKDNNITGIWKNETDFEANYEDDLKKCK